MPCWHDIPASFPVRRKVTALCTVHILRLLSSARVCYDIADMRQLQRLFNCASIFVDKSFLTLKKATNSARTRAKKERIFTNGNNCARKCIENAAEEWYYILAKRAAPGGHDAAVCTEMPPI